MSRKQKMTVPAILCALILSLLFAGYGDVPSLSGAISSSLRLIVDTFTGHGIGADYYGFRFDNMWLTLRLVLLSVTFACMLSAILFYGFTQIRVHFLKRIISSFIDFMELIPETMYIICTVLIAIILIERYQLNLPVFPVTAPSWVDTLIPALALAVPSGLYLFRILVVHYQDELQTDYKQTAQSKGLSERRVFFRHVLPNVVRQSIGAFPTVTATILSSAMFTEFFFGYQGMLFRLSEDAGWKMFTGLLTMQKQRYFGQYNIGTITLVLFILVALWFLSLLMTKLANRTFFPPNAERYSGAYVGHIQKSWVIAGCTILLAFILFGLFPNLLTNHLPSKAYVPMWHVYGLSRNLPFGSDNYGRDVFSRMLYGTPRTLFIIGTITVTSVLGSFLLALFSVATESRLMQNMLEVIGRALSPLPALAILFFLMLHRRPSSPHQLLTYILWISIICVGRGAYSFQNALRSYFQFKFIEGVHSIGASRLRAILVDLRPWLWRYGLEFTFSQMVIVLCLMVELAAFHTFPTVTLDRPPYRVWMYILPPPAPALDSAHLSWLSVIGPITTYYSYVSYPSILYGPVLTILAFTIGAGCLAKGFRGKVSSP